MHYILFIPPPWVWLDLLSTFVLTPFLIFFSEEDPDFVPNDIDLFMEGLSNPDKLEALWKQSKAKKLWDESLLALLKYLFYPLFILDNGMNLISKSLTVLTLA